MSNLNKKCICDKICLNLETLADIGHFTSCPQKDEKTWWQKNQVIEDALIEIRLLVKDMHCENAVNLLEVESFLRTFAEKIYKEAREEVIEEIEKELEHWTDNYQNWKTRIGSSDLTEATFKVEALADLLKALKEK